MFAQKKILLEVKMPKEVLKPLRAMEQVFTALWGNVYDPPAGDRWETWIDGKTLDSLQLEMVSLNGESHLFVRCLEGRRNAVEATIYSQYPDAEISLVEDYTKHVPRDIPNKDWDMWGTDYIMMKSDVYPIKTYARFFEEKPEGKEEKRIDPLSTLLEGMSKLGPGEQLWVQIAATPIISSSKEEEGARDFIKEGRAIADKIARRPEKGTAGSIWLEAAEEVASGKVPGEEKTEESIIPPEMKLTPGEREILSGIEEKIAQRCFICYIRFIYLAKRDVYFGGAKGIPFGFFNQFATENLNALRPWPKTLTKIKKSVIFFPLNLIRERRVFIRKRRLFFRYINRFAPMYPKPSAEGAFILDSEELATLFHFPGRAVSAAPFVSRVETKKGEAPAGLPMEE